MTSRHMSPLRTAGASSDRDTGLTIAAHRYAVPVVREVPIKPPDAPPRPGWPHTSSEEGAR
jgi:hypothetical protein